MHDQLAVAIASMWKEALGVEVQLAAVEFKSLLQDIDRGDVDMFRSSWVGDYNDAYTFAQYLKSDFGINLPHYRKRGIRRAARRAPQPKSIPPSVASCSKQAERAMLRDHPLIPLYFYVNKHLVKPRGARLVRQRHERRLQQGSYRSWCASGALTNA